MNVMLEPEGWPVLLKHTPPGPFIVLPQGMDVGEGFLCFRSEYQDQPGCYQTFNEAGETLCLDHDTTWTQPVKMVWNND